MPDGAPLRDPGPDETAKRGLDLAFTWDGTAAGVVGWGDAGLIALELAAEHLELVDRLVLVATPVPAEPFVPPHVEAKVLLVFDSRDGGNARASWWRKAIGGRVEMISGEGDDILVRVWPRVLSHLAPRRAAG